MPRFDFKTWEITLIVVLFALLGVSTTLYFADVPIIRRYVFGIDDETRRENAGKITAVKGSIRRQLGNETEFKPINEGTSVFNEDAIVTGSDSSAVMILNDGGTIELAPNTMVKLTFETQLSMGGVSHAANVEVVGGNVTGESKKAPIIIKTRDGVVSLSKNKRETVAVLSTAPRKPPPPALAKSLQVSTPVESKPEPSPTPEPSPIPKAVPPPPSAPSVRISFPQENAILEVEPRNGKPERVADLRWATEPMETQAIAVLRRLESGKLREVLRETVKSEKGTGRVATTLRKPGTYEWELFNLPDQPKFSQTRRFRIAAEFKGIETLPPLVGGALTNSNRISGDVIKDFDITLRWKPLQTAKHYEVEVTTAQNGGKTLIKKSVNEPVYVFNKGRIYAGQFFYRIKSPLPGGFVSTSQPQPFTFEFSPPALVLPADKSVLPPASSKDLNSGILFTWQRTNFTDAYEIEVASNEKFVQPILKKRATENFHLFKTPMPGNYWWRVRSLSKAHASEPSAAFRFSIGIK